MGQAEAFRRGQAADQFVQSADAQNGHVQVEVTLKNAPPGTTAKVTTAGPVKASPPRVATSMPFTD